MRTVTRPGDTRIRDRFAASDPGLLRLMAGLRTVGAIALTLAVLWGFGANVNYMVSGAMASMVSTFAVKEKRRRGQAVTLALGLPAAFAAVTLGALLNTRVVAGDFVFLALIFVAVYCRRFGERGTALGLIAFQLYFVALFVGAVPSDLPKIFATLAIGFACSAVVRFGLVVETPERVLIRLRKAFRARLVFLVSAQIDLLDAGPDGVEKALEGLRRSTARLHESAMLIQGRLEEGTDDDTTAALVQRRVAEAEIAAERLSMLLLTARSEERAETLTLHLPNAPVPETTHRLGAPEDVERLARRDLEALRLLVARSGSDEHGSAVAHVRNRLLGYRDEENLPDASAAVQDMFRGIGELARTVLGLRLALDGPQDETYDAPATTRSREELDAEDASIAGAIEAEEEEEPTGLRRPSTRTAVQVSVGSALAIIGGELLSAQRWYWAVLTCWVVFLNTGSTGEILVKGSRRLLGTLLGVIAGAALAQVVGNHTWTAFVLVLVLIFLMYFTAPLSYLLTSFFVTAMLGLLYTLLNTYSPAVLVLRIEETALGAACGIFAAAFVLPVPTDHRTDELLASVLERLGEVSSAAVDQLSGGSVLDLLDKSRELDTALDELRASTKPLTHPVTPLRSRRQTARYLVALLETCAYHARVLAATAELLPYSKKVAADPRLKGAGRHIAHNIDVLVARVEEGASSEAAEGGASLTSLLETKDRAALPRHDRVTDRVLRHLQRLDEGVIGLARPLGVSVATPEGHPSRTAAS
ncbi:FUSC family protein [Streptomyces fructofermentans]|uniref:Membrane protein n=1 Tax=Streptomyces fructofermentans TaxID=152141 RepID=A0A918NNV5_9ACTN|nr:membrane protein [Streptomyces fructofermentans]